MIFVTFFKTALCIHTLLYKHDSLVVSMKWATIG